MESDARHKAMTSASVYSKRMTWRRTEPLLRCFCERATRMQLFSQQEMLSRTCLLKWGSPPPSLRLCLHFSLSRSFFFSLSFSHSHVLWLRFACQAWRFVKEVCTSVWTEQRWACLYLFSVSLSVHLHPFRLSGILTGAFPPTCRNSSLLLFNICHLSFTCAVLLVLLSITYCCPFCLVMTDWRAWVCMCVINAVYEASQLCFCPFLPLTAHIHILLVCLYPLCVFSQCVHNSTSNCNPTISEEHLHWVQRCR